LSPSYLDLGAEVDDPVWRDAEEISRARFPSRHRLSGTGHHLIVFGAAPRLDHLRARWEKLVSIVDATNLHFDATEAGVPNGGAILVRPDGFIGFRAAPANETTMDALDTHLATYLVPGFHQAV